MPKEEEYERFIHKTNYYYEKDCCTDDEVFVYVLLVVGAVSTEVVYLAYKGDAAITWSGACGSLGKFCHKATASLAITFAIVICYAVLSLVSSYRLFSRYDAPIGYTNKGIDMSAVFRT
ncbi:hypothetical protein POM88_052240 [Heracleum sosnowskyi]|uniref:CASP-like protein n=1 Tax=Heracleum sosnowskyi TaxID=360622 RepID=A0AAD8GTH8_9APIA|nr:hypothetical protein POM88_052240 [Heracleum sosnowskyi]